MKGKDTEGLLKDKEQHWEMLILHKEKLLCREDIKLMEEVKSLYINFSFEFYVFHLTGVALAIYIKVMLLFS